MKIAGTRFELTEFADAWAIACDYAGKWIDSSAVREALLEAQRAFGRTGGVVLEGRDIMGGAQTGTGNAVCLVCPDGVVSIALHRSDSGRIRAFVLMAVSTNFAGAYRRNEADVLAIARDMGAHQLAFRSSRRGWAKLLGPEWTRVGDTYERGL